MIASRRSWVWGVAIGWAVLVLLLGIGFLTGSWGYVLVVGAPFMAGFVVGGYADTAFVVKILLVVIAVVAVIAAAVMVNLAGAICGWVMGWIAAVPLILGVFTGNRVSGRIKPRVMLYSVAFVALLIPLEGIAVPHDGIESVVTEHIVDMTPQQAFERIQFYEDTSGTPPRLLRVALPRPIKTVGDGSRVGNVQKCIYDIGYLRKEITEVRPGRRYAFKVIEQVGVESHSVALTTGSFDFFQVGHRRTRIDLTTSYRPKLAARLAWRPFEEAVIRALHDHVIASMTS